MGFNLKEPLFVSGLIAGPQRPEIGSQRLSVTALEDTMRNKIL